MEKKLRLRAAGAAGAAVLLAVATPLAISADAFQIKGVKLGVNPAEVCGQAEVKDAFSEILARAGDAAAKVIPLNALSCDGAIASFAGVPLKSESSMLFLDGRLILLKLEVGAMTMQELADAVDALTTEYGKPKIQAKKNEGTLTWRKGNSTLFIERHSTDWDSNHLTLFLTDEPGVKEFRTRHQEALRELHEYSKRSTHKQIIN